MKFMNQYEIEDAAAQHAAHPVLGPATRTLSNLMEWTNSNSDGWCYWPKPARAAKQLMDLIDTEGGWRYRQVVDSVTPAQYRKALAPIKAFRTRQKADFEIVEVAA